MKFICVGIIVALAVAEISAGVGEYVPKSFFTIGQNGQASPLFHISDTKQVLNRLRRSPQVQTSSSSSSSSSYSNDGGPVYFNQQTAVHSSGPSGLGSRFGGDDVPSSGGHFTQTTGVIGKDGKVHYNTQSGKF